METMTHDPEHPDLEHENRPSDSEVEAPDVAGVPDPEAGPPPAGYGGKRPDDIPAEELHEGA